MKRALQLILVLALAGLVFSGTLTYREVFASAAKCPAPGAPGTILDIRRASTASSCIRDYLTAIVGLRSGRRTQEIVDARSSEP